MRRVNSSIVVDFNTEKGLDNVDRTYFAYIPLENMACYAVAESYDGDNDIDSAKLAVESVLTAFERNPSFRNLKQYIKYAHDQIVANSVKNMLQTAITVVVSDYTRIRYASCGNIKLYLLSDSAFYLKSETQTYYQHAADEYGLDKAPVAENKNLLQYLGKKNGPRPFVSKKLELLEESTLLFATCSFWERVDDVELLDAYEESDHESFLSNIQELYLLTQLHDPSIKSYALASLFIEKTFKEDTAKKKKRRRIMMIAAAAAVVLAIIVYIIISMLRAGDRQAMAEIERLDFEGIRYSNYGNYPMAFEQYDKAKELTGKLRNNLQYTQDKRSLTAMIAERWHLYNSIKIGDEYLASGEYFDALKAYQDAQNAYYDLYEGADILSELMVSGILSDKIGQANIYIEIHDLIRMGEMYEVDEMYLEALACFEEAEGIVKTIGDLALRKELITRIFETNRKINSSIETNLIRNLQALMKKAENSLDFDKALQYCEIILGVYEDLGVTDSQSQEDKERIEGKIRLDSDVASFIERAQKAESENRFEDAIREYETVLDLFKDMEIGVGHARYLGVRDEIVRIYVLIEEQIAQENAAQGGEPGAEAGGAAGGAAAEGEAGGQALEAADG